MSLSYDSTALALPDQIQDETSFCPLLELAPELRNHIYEYALLSGDDTMITNAGFAAPGLLAVNKQIRSEAKPVFYARSRFQIVMHDFHAVAIYRWVLIASEMGIQPTADAFYLSTQSTWTPHWRNLVGWARMLHKTEVRLAIGRRESQLITTVICSVLSTAAKLRGSKWSQVCAALECQRKILIALDPAWADDR